MTKILFPTDFSPNALNAFNYALNLAEKLDAKVDLIHVYNITFDDASAMPYDFVEQQLKEKEEWVREQFNALLKDRDQKYIGHSKSIYGVFPVMETLDFAKENDYDYIVMGTKGRKNRIEKLLGSITSGVMMKAHCPVIGVPEGVVFSPVNKIAYATAFEPSDKHPVEELITFAEKNGASMHFVNVNTKSAENSASQIRKIDDYAKGFKDFTIVNNYSVVEGLTGYIADYGIDMLALYVPHRRLWERIFHQSITKRMALQTDIPLIVFHG